MTPFKKILTAVLAFAVLVSSVIIAVQFTGSAAVDYAQSINFSDYTKLSLAPGSDPGGLNFAWYTASSVTGTPTVQIAKKSDMTGGAFPTGYEEFKGTATAAISGYLSNKVSVTGLEDNTEYVYRYGKGGGWSAIASYTTRDPGQFGFIYVGDPQIGAADQTADTNGWNDTVEKALTAMPEASFLLSAGDQVNSGDNEGQYAGFLSPAAFASLPVATTIGNHDQGNANYSYHFNNPNTTEYGSTSAGTDYYFTYGSALFIVLNTNNTDAAEHKSHIAQAVEQYPGARWRIVMMHHDIYGSGDTHSTQNDTLELRQKLFPIMDAYDIDVVLTGHDHSYTRSYQMEKDMPLPQQTENAAGAVVNPAGTMYMTANSSSGSKYYGLNSFTGLYVAARSQLKVPTFATVRMSDTTFEIKTIRTDTMAVTDSYTILKTVSKEELGAAIAEAESKLPDEDLYTAESWAIFESALNEARETADDDNATEEQVSDAKQALEAAIAGLTPKDSVKPGDVDGNGTADVSDVVKLRELILAGNATDEQKAAGDLNGDNKLDSADVALLLAQINLKPGDVNNDGQVGPLDIMLIRKAMLNSETTDQQLAAGDLDGSGGFTALDIILLRKLLLA